MNKIDVIPDYVYWLLIAAILLTQLSCGKQEVEVGGKVEVEHKLNVENLRKYFKQECTTKVLGDKCYSEDVDVCTECMVGDFLENT